MKITVRRETLSPCCAGTMEVDGDLFGFTLERPWLENKRQVSAIPAGKYAVTIRFSPRFRRSMLTLANVPGRAGILIHGANRWTELKGCIAVSAHRPTPTTLQGDLSPRLKGLVEAALRAGETVTIEIINPQETTP